MKRRRFHLFYLCSLLAVALLAVGSFPRQEDVFPLDDAYIHWVYAESIARGDGFSFNLGEESMGTSSPLFVLLGALGLRLGFPYYSFTVFTSTLLFAGGSALIFLILVRLLGDYSPDLPAAEGDLLAWLGGLLFLTNGNFIWYVLAGMETPLFIFLGLLGVHLYLRRGWDWLTGIVLGLLIWTRITGLTLLAVLFLTDLCRRKPSWRGWVVTGLVYAPFLLFCLNICGSLLPTNVAAKRITYIDGEWSPYRFLHFFPAVFRYLGLLPAYWAAAVITGLGFIFLPVRLRRRRRKGLPPPSTRGVMIILGWGVVHIVVYGLSFRTLLHHLRYLSVIYPVLAVTAPAVLSSLPGRGGRWRTVLAAGLVLLSGWNLGAWSQLYRRNVDHIRQVYFPAASWLARNTPVTARIAAFDIGVIKWVSGRYIVDLGGLVDPEVHPHLRDHSAGDYLWKRRADYIVHSCEPDCDIFTGIYLSEYQGDRLLRQRPEAAFRTAHYPMPTITHSTCLKINRVEQWLDSEGPDLARLFVVEDPLIDHPGRKVFRDAIILIGYNLAPNPVVRCPEMFQTLDLTYFWTVGENLKGVFWVVTELKNAEGRTVWSKSHIPTHNRYPPGKWKPGEVIRDHHLLWLTRRIKPGKYEISLSLVRKKSRGGGVEAGRIVIGSLTVRESPLKPVRFKWKHLK